MDLTLFWLALWVIFLQVTGYFLAFFKSKFWARLLGWSLAILTTVFSVWATEGQPAVFRMFAIVFLQLVAMKIIVLIEERFGKSNLNFIQWSAFSLGWFGMRPSIFKDFPSKPLSGILPILGKALSRILLGLLFLYISKWLENQGVTSFFPKNLLALVGLSFILHFGILNLTTAFWRLFGVDARELFRAPYFSKSLQEFWGKRWNLAFSEMTALVAYRPLKNILESNLAMILSFLLSGILHEIAISGPVNAGFGLPIFYFALHATAMFLEREIDWVKKIIVHPILSRCWVFAWLILPMPLLFHQYFLVGVILPLRDLMLSFLFS
jgi:alginate O-acetyltransferase complex protein AlgI